RSRFSLLSSYMNTPRSNSRLRSRLLALMGAASASQSPAWPGSPTARWLSLGLGLAALGAGSLAHAQATWVGNTDQDWNKVSNWSTDPAAPTGDFKINTSAPGSFP